MKAFKADGITVQQFNEPAGGQVVFHLHMHVMPRHDGIALLPPASRKEDVKVLEDNATKLIAALKGRRHLRVGSRSVICGGRGFDRCARIDGWSPFTRSRNPRAAAGPAA